ncbi:Methionine aminopeptidase 2 [Rhodotorula mucilaginosa]|uniref:Methionine aminopeptidase 2 n=1 Tax=Rhodotorula mucilaginosa TaxID=5537 RepID=A0A9P7BAL1_RHOMI|nr:Methionine aminopeptidase 2 [Rhodotorula mucilaginosa]TKA57387.1 Methionine aminopeptidase 2 [Rhodotorula sp. CCFEE 5036]
MAQEAAAGNASAAPAAELATLKISADAASSPPAATNGHAAEQHDDDNDDEDGEDDAAEPAANGATEKKKSNKKKKKGGAAVQQTEPPTVPVTKFFKDGQFPVGETHEYLNDNSYRTTSEEMREKERLLMQEDENSPHNYNAIRRAAEVHRQVRQYARAHIKPGMQMTDIADMIENGTRALVEENGMKSGIGFPTGLSRNHCAAHWTPNAGDKTVLQAEDVLKVDFGVHVNGRIVDSAFTLNWEPTYDNLLKAVQEATETGVKEAGIDVRMGHIGAAIQEVMESYEVEVGGKTHQVKSIRNLTGHSIDPYIIHAGKSVPIVASYDPEDEEAGEKMEEGEYFAIETFGSTGRGYVSGGGECSHYARMAGARAPLRHDSSKRLLASIDKNFGTLPWCKRYLDRTGEKGYALALRELVQTGIVQDYPPLYDEEGCQTAQFEHTIILRPTCKEVVTRGDDY